MHVILIWMSGGEGSTSKVGAGLMRTLANETQRCRPTNFPRSSKNFLSNHSRSGGRQWKIQVQQKCKYIARVFGQESLDGGRSQVQNDKKGLWKKDPMSEIQLTLERVLASQVKQYISRKTSDVGIGWDTCIGQGGDGTTDGSERWFRVLKELECK